ncbi:nucleoside-diphosphate kinase [Petrotoga sp. 9PWA.NaAc.5.4]|uniref:nucleoside-diphosphate kinase n=1 Tax=Petrotoga sp. 9PWA.NaAc.5.4 TaxID=1434328 RepID=UPI000CBD52AD|nr:nucleoside diphosphate kinase [Petrotoga sp. 9PWA.NaAc.5.4]
MEREFVFIKPNAVRRSLIGEIISRYEKKGLKIIALKMIQMTKTQSEKLYKEHEGKDFYKPLIDFVLSGPVLVMVLEGERAVEVVRHMHGDTDPLKAFPGSIRGDYGLTVRKNIVHASDSQEKAEKEWQIFFDQEELLEYSIGEENF